ncbi:MAG: 50S ribosomal protein L35 [Oscillospiraceae bacterium]|jgi:large subunit ribosomal protein L35
MPKLKSRGGAKKRLAFTKNGKIKRAHAFSNHFTGKRPAKRSRSLRKGTYADKTNEKSIRRMLPYG